MKNVVKFVTVIFLTVVLIFLSYNLIFVKFINKRSLENSVLEIAKSTQNSPFSISKIMVYSSGYGINKNTNFQQNNWLLDIMQYSDIAIFIDNGLDSLDASNTVKSLGLSNISVSAPKLGSGNLYYLDTLNFGTSNIDENYKLADTIEFTVINDSNEDNWAQYNTPIFFTDCSNPITLKYVNNPVKENFEIQAHEPVFFDGSLLKMANIPLDDLATNISFTINLKSNDNRNFMYKISLPINLQSESSSIYEGSILSENEYQNCRFMEVGN